MFRVIGHKEGVGTASYEFDGVDKDDFVPLEDSSIFIGRRISSQNSIYTQLGLLVGELPFGCKKRKLDNYQCDIQIAFDSTFPNASVIESGCVHIITPNNKTIPLSLVGYDFSSSCPTRQHILKTLINHTDVSPLTQPDQQSHGCSPFQLTAEALIEFIQEDALPKSFMRYFTTQLPLWINVMVRENNKLFDVENAMVYLVNSTDKQCTYRNCKFPSTVSPSALLAYRPIISYNISVENEKLSLSSKGNCFLVDICRNGVFLTLSDEASKEISSMPFIKDMANGGWDLLFSSFGFTSPRRFNSIANSVPGDPLAEHFSNFHYNMWWQGRADILLRNSGEFAMNMKMAGEVFAFVGDLNSVSVIIFLQIRSKKV